MKNVVVVGSQWGDEGKGKIVDWLSSEADVVVRFQGGHNAGHTLVIDSRVRKEARSWKKSESLVFVTKILCSFLCFCHRVYFSVLEKGSVDLKVLVPSKINSDV